MSKNKHIYTSHIRIFKDEDMVRRAYIEGFEDPTLFGVHTKIKDFYGLEPKIEYPATLDYIIAATGGWLTGTFGRVLEVRGIPSAPDCLRADVEGDIDSIDGVMRITKIRVHYHLKYKLSQKVKVDRAFQYHAEKCPAYKTLKDVVKFHLSLTELK